MEFVFGFGVADRNGHRAKKAKNRSPDERSVIRGMQRIPAATRPRIASGLRQLSRPI